MGRSVSSKQEKYKKDGVISPTQEILLETKHQERARKEALMKSPNINKLSEPYVCDNGRTLVYFKRGADVQRKGEEFESNRRTGFIRHLTPKE